MVYFILVILGLCFGSFVNAFVWRLHEQEIIKEQIDKLGKKKASAQKVASLEAKLKPLSISKGRSMCPRCKHILSAKDLIPVLSWVELRGKCRYCKAPIDDTPFAELGVAALFVTSYIWWPMAFDAHGIVNFIVWLGMIVGFMALLIYDRRWLTLPNRIVYPLTAIALLLSLVNITAFHGGVVVARDTAFALVIDGGLFYGLFELSKGKWIGGGDVKLGFLIGFLIAAAIPGFLVLFIASVLGTAVILPGLITKRLSAQSHIPFGPFLVMSTILVKLFGASIIAWYRRKFLLY